MRAFLRAADKREESNPQLKEWVEKVREIAHDTEDVIERYMLAFSHLGRDSNGCNLYMGKMYALAKNLIVRHQVASEFQQIKLRLDNISQSRQRFTETYNLMDEGSGPKTNDTRGDALLLEGIDVVGIEEPKKQITEWLV
ncbi:Nbs-lrr resistance protein [Dorcoceras hygrometricum]|uniref:Nbs-lrr resistance protein n=1 Tax=Dorcoceras hygrometricum TaxID=472368 RepID=A0A2Z7CAH7_9LAMI|nr:Nbs-lrr resistance protein [Dorcoceras hygrometricum]